MADPEWEPGPSDSVSAFPIPPPPHPRPGAERGGEGGSKHKEPSVCCGRRFRKKEGAAVIIFQ